MMPRNVVIIIADIWLNLEGETKVMERLRELLECELGPDKPSNSISDKPIAINIGGQQKLGLILLILIFVPQGEEYLHD